MKIALVPLIAFFLLNACVNISEQYNSKRAQIEEDLAVDLYDGRQTLNFADQIDAGIPQIRTESVAQIVFPKAFKAGLFVGGNYSEGFIFKDNKPLGRIRMSGGNIGPQIGGQQYSQVMYIMTDSKLREFLSSKAVKFQGTISYAKNGEYL